MSQSTKLSDIDVSEISDQTDIDERYIENSIQNQRADERYN